MMRWRLILLALVLLALILWGVLLSPNLRPELTGRGPHDVSPFSNPDSLQKSLSGLPAWIVSLELLVTLFIAGMANFYLFPRRVRNMQEALAMGPARILQMALLGFGFALLIIVFALGAALARVTFVFTLLAGLTLFFLSIWGYLSVAYSLGRSLLVRAGWQRSWPAAGLALGLLLLLPLVRIPRVGGLFVIIYVSIGFGLVISTHFGSNEPWNLTPLLEEDKE